MLKSDIPDMIPEKNFYRPFKDKYKCYNHILKAMHIDEEDILLTHFKDKEGAHCPKFIIFKGMFIVFDAGYHFQG